MVHRLNPILLSRSSFSFSAAFAVHSRTSINSLILSHSYFSRTAPLQADSQSLMFAFRKDIRHRSLLLFRRPLCE
ncbi:hypothetical protein SprV_0200569800 [Sparganum proliferum]